MIAGPSEILIVADGASDPRCVAADLLSQAEHDRLASAVLVTDSADLAVAVQAELEVQIPLLSPDDAARGENNHFAVKRAKHVLAGWYVQREQVGTDDSGNPVYSYGAMAVAIPAWSLGTLTGYLLGSILPMRLISALSVSLYAMFISVFVPEAKRNRVVLGLVLFCFGASALATWLPLLSGISSGVKILLLTITISLAAAILFPRDEDGEVLS
jgi:hypothetical protein